MSSRTREVVVFSCRAYRGTSIQIVRRSLLYRAVLPIAGDRGLLRQQSITSIANGSPRARLHRMLDSTASTATSTYSRRHASSEYPRSVEWHISSARATGLEWAGNANSSQKSSIFMDDDELERRLNGPEAIAAASKSSASTSRTHEAKGGRSNRALSNRAPRLARPSEQMETQGVPAQLPADYKDALDELLQTSAGLVDTGGGSSWQRGRVAEGTSSDDSNWSAEAGSCHQKGGLSEMSEGTRSDGEEEPLRHTLLVQQPGYVKHSEEQQSQESLDSGLSATEDVLKFARESAKQENMKGAQLEGVEHEENVRWTASQLWNMQLKREERSQAEACEKYCKMLDDMVTLGKAVNLKPVQRILLTWYRPLINRIEEEQAAVWKDMPDSDKDTVAKSGAFGGRSVYGPLLVLLKAEKLAVLVMHEIVSLCLAEGNKGVPTLKACKQVADLVQAEVNDLRLNKKLGTKEVRKLNMSGRNHVREVNKQAERALDSLEYADWPLAARIKLGAALIKFLLETAAWSEEGRPAFVHEVRSMQVRRRHGVIAMDEAVYSKMIDEDISSFVAPRFVPMVVPPQNWTRSDRGGYLRLRSQVMRIWGDKGQKEALKLADLKKVFDGLNCLAKVRWSINTTILDLASKAWEENMEVGDLPRRMEIPRPEVPEGLKLTPKGGVKIADKSLTDDPGMKKIANAYRRSLDKVRMKNANLHSLRCDLRLKMSIAEEFREHTVYFPYNMDFRGRTYPVPPNLNILGSDFCRGVLMFDEARPLGERGLYWLKVHLANLWGEDKVSFDDRVEFTETHLNKIRDSALAPLDGQGWWMNADKPWQCLSACRDLTAALDSPDPAQYRSRLPVHQDGSCNGLQHYAALGLDENGGAQVNLLPASKPQDVYTSVCEVVKRKVAAEARTVPPPGARDDVVKRHRLAKMVNGKIDRKVVKQTVMTSVYGVTFVGARRQIQNQIEERLSNGEVLSDEDEAEVYAAASYLATLTMSVLGELFENARGIMEWLVDVALLVAKEGQPVSWVTPLGLPVQQPYRSNSGFQVQTLLQGVHLVEENEHLPVAIARQKSAFPPNFVHSLDSTHMFLTAMEMDKANVPFAAVHDSYWVHAGNIDEMNVKLRQCFVDLYSGPVLEDLYESLQLRYPTVEFPPIPPRGTLKLEKVKDSPYFFN